MYFNSKYLVYTCTSQIKDESELVTKVVVVFVPQFHVSVPLEIFTEKI